MPFTENTTLDRIQREIMDVMEREKELRKFYNKNSNNNEINTNGNSKINGNDRPPLIRAQSTSVLLGGEASNTTNFRRFSSNPNARGVMQRFLKSKGKINAVSALTNTKPSNGWTVQDFAAAKITMEPGKKIRNGFVPVNERIRQEFEEAHKREAELRLQRRKSQPNLDLMDLDAELDQPMFGGMRATKSMAQLYDSTENLEETVSAPPSLKQARSLAELCDATEEEIQTPQSLIMQFEKMIIKNKQTKRT